VALAAAVAASVAAAPASAQSGGTTAGAPTAGPPAADPTYYDVPFGSRDLSAGMNGADVQTLNWVLRGLALGTGHDGAFGSVTDSAVRSVQAGAGLAANGVVNIDTRKALAARMLNQNASWYGPTFYGNTTACGQTLRKTTFGVAHKKLPCGTRVVFAYRGSWVRATVIDRGPYIKGRAWDLTRPLARALGTIPAGTARVKVAVAP
jgi:rare lipoprotein A (peptidoglycan hydrolase)